MPLTFHTVCAPGLGQIHGTTGFLNVEANWNYRKKIRDGFKTFLMCFSLPKPQLHMFFK